MEKYLSFLFHLIYVYILFYFQDVDAILESQKFKDVDSDNILDHEWVKYCVLKEQNHWILF